MPPPTDTRTQLDETPAQIADRVEAIMKRCVDLSALRMSIPVRPDDDDMVLVLAAKMLRALSAPSSLAPPQQDEPAPEHPALAELRIVVERSFDYDKGGQQVGSMFPGRMAPSMAKHFRALLAAQPSEAPSSRLPSETTTDD